MGDMQDVSRGISPVTVGQKCFREQASKIAAVEEIDSLDTGKYHDHLGLVKEKKDKSKQTPETHANDPIAIATTAFIEYKAFNMANTHGHEWIEECNVTSAPFIVLTRRKLYQEKYEKGGTLKRQGGTITPFSFRLGDYVQTS